MYMKSLRNVCSIGIAPVSLAVSAQPPGRPIELTVTEIRDGLHEVRTGTGVSPVFVFLATDEGIVVVDPPNPTAGNLLKQELDERFSRSARTLRGGEPLSLGPCRRNAAIRGHRGVHRAREHGRIFGRYLD